ncbi:GDP-L-fucose synthase [Kaistia defluvii]|uniref:GDP-L-fucose synthase family protein n=1 Tax=Kaistia defluvii TaxID=410841 RepID=UPI00225AFA0B|nr:GDP-L-fucose synthase [Kaistia defluvii]MCX5519514.1 GDP-L-fucose synthase [Kaistia defluvii]
MTATHEPDSFDLAGKRIWVAGHRGMVGSALLRRLRREPCEILTVTSGELDLRRQSATEAWIDANAPDAIVIAAARVGGIVANATHPAPFIYDNLAIATHIIEGARRAGVAKLLYLGSSCMYPREAIQPMRETALLSGPLEPTNEPYAVAKIAGLKLAESYHREYGCRFITAVPPNLYGPNDNYDPDSAHVLAALIRRFHLAKLDGSPSVTIWGTGLPMREFLHVDDLADACVLLLRRYEAPEPINVGSGQEISIHDLATLVADITGYSGTILTDLDRPDGTPRKLMDSSRLNSLGWRPSIGLLEGIESSYRAWLDGSATMRAI